MCCIALVRYVLVLLCGSAGWSGILIISEKYFTNFQVFTARIFHIVVLWILIPFSFIGKQ